MVDFIRVNNIKIMIKKTFKDLEEIDSIVGSIYHKNPEIKDTKFGYAYKRFSEKNLIPIFKQYNELLSDIRIENALEDEKTKAILHKEGGRGFEYSKEGLKAVIKAERELGKEWNDKEFEIEPYIISEENLPELNDEQKEILEGVLF